VKTLSEGAGYQWIKQHLRKHPVWEAFENSKHVSLDNTFLVSPDAINTCKWLEWIVEENRELSFCEKEKVRKYTEGNLGLMTVKTLKKRMDLIVQVMEDEISKLLPSVFGIAFDGWSEFSVHYLSVFAVGPNLPHNRPILLGFSTFENEGDLSANEHRNYLNQLLSYYKRDESTLGYFIGDHSTVNRKLSFDIRVPMVGCASRRL
jgi:hypothetical protein